MEGPREAYLIFGSHVSAWELCHKYVPRYLLHLFLVLKPLLDKSGKKFAPKAPIRRPAAPGAPSSTNTSARASIDRLPSQTPQLPEVQQHVASPTPRPSTPASTRLQQPSALVAAPVFTTDVATLVPKPRSKARPDIRPSIERSPQPPITPCKRAFISDSLPNAGTSANGILVAADAPGAELSPPQSEAREQGISRAPAEASSVEPTVSAAKGPTPPISQGTEDEIEQGRSPAAKRQRTENGRRDASTGTGKAVSSRSIEIPASTAQEDHTTAPDPTSTLPRASKRKQSVKGKNKRHVETVTDENVADATRSSSSRAKKGTAPAKKAVRKRRTKAKRPQSAEDAAAAEIVADSVEGTATTVRKRGRRRQTTPDNAEEVQIEVEKVTMADLCKDPRTGKMSKAEAEFRAFDEERARKRQQQITNGEGSGDRVDEILEAAGVVRQQSRGAQVTEPVEEPQYGSSQVIPETRIVNGEIVIDMDSLQVDRQALAEVQRNQEPTEIIEESGITRRVNYGTFRKKIVRTRWTEESTELFYDGLRMFGTDFEMISKMFPGRTRRHVKLKFVKEERVNCARIKETLLGEKVPVDMDELSKISNIKFRDVEEFNRELDSDRLELEEWAAQERQEKDDALQLRTDEAAAEAAAVGADSSGDDDDRNGRDKTEGSLSGKSKHRNSSSALPGRRDAGRSDSGPIRQGATPEVDSDGALDITNEPAPTPAKRSRGKAMGRSGNAGGKRPPSGVAAPGKTASRSTTQHRRAETTRAAAGGRNRVGILQSVE